MTAPRLPVKGRGANTSEQCVHKKVYLVHGCKKRETKAGANAGGLSIDIDDAGQALRGKPEVLVVFEGSTLLAE